MLARAFALTWAVHTQDGSASHGSDLMADTLVTAPVWGSAEMCCMSGSPPSGYHYALGILLSALRLEFRGHDVAHGAQGT